MAVAFNTDNMLAMTDSNGGRGVLTIHNNDDDGTALAVVTVESNGVHLRVAVNLDVASVDAMANKLRANRGG